MTEFYNIKINEISLENYRQFKVFKYTFYKRINIFKGLTFSGKTSICEAIRKVLHFMMLCFFYGFSYRENNKDLFERNIIESINDDDIYFKNRQKEKKVSIKIKGFFFDKNYSLSKSKQRYTENFFDFTKKNWGKLKDRIEEEKEEINKYLSAKQSLNVIYPFFGYYKNTIEKEESKIAEIYGENLLIPYMAYYNSTIEETNYSFFRSWVRKIFLQAKFSELHGRKDFEFCRDYLDLITKISKRIIKEIKNIDIDELEWDYKRDIFYVVINEQRRTITEIIGRGYESLYYSIIDIVHRIIRLNGSDEDIFKETQGVVILDNFEKFDENIFEKYVNLISDIFPKIQFFISGNSFEMKQKREDVDYIDLNRGLF
jgi:predicted ATP-binding protein involved in virulence